MLSVLPIISSDIAHDDGWSRRREISAEDNLDVDIAIANGELD